MSLCCLGLLSCQQNGSPGARTVADSPPGDGDHMVSVGTPPPPPVPAPPPKRDKDRDEWAPVALENGQAFVSCDTDYAAGEDEGDGPALTGLDKPSIEAALAPCQSRGLVRLRYEGKINAGFAELVRRMAEIAARDGIGKRVLDLDSSGGQVEAAIRAGDAIGESSWTIWVREGSICHSACVFVLAAGDNRLISGKVGIHRMMRISSTATSRAELNRELQEVYGSVKDYLERNGVAVAVADLMMTVPNRSLRLLSADELKQYGLDGTNAVQDDLERIKQLRKCGDEFVRRKDAFLVAFDQECKAKAADLETLTACGQALKRRFGFPDEACPAESPLSEIDVATLPLSSPGA
ncbi:hypothetical protein JR065_01875 [Xanthomonas sp. AmX2]|nr:hypothetical protein [Xanthomonas sp.]